MMNMENNVCRCLFDRLNSSTRLVPTCVTQGIRIENLVRERLDKLLKRVMVAASGEHEADLLMLLQLWLSCLTAGE